MQNETTIAIRNLEIQDIIKATLHKNEIIRKIIDC